jgi:hypothetical protein
MVLELYDEAHPALTHAIEHLLYYDKEPSSALKRAEYIYKKLQLPESERIMRVPE